MGRREIIQETQGRLLSSTSTEEASETILELNSFLDSIHRSSEFDEYQKSKAARQPVFGAMSELVLRKATANMSAHVEDTGSLLRDDIDEAGYEEYSPTLRRFLSTMDRWFGPVVREVMEEARQGKMPQAAILEAGRPAQDRRKLTDRWWCNHLVAKGESAPWPPADDFEKAFLDAMTKNNIPHIASAIIGRSLHSKTLVDAVDKGEITRKQLEDVTYLSSVVSKISRHILGKTGVLLSEYSNWEMGEQGDEEFMDQVRDISWVTNESYHPGIENGRFKNPGTCSVDLLVSYPDAFAVHPDTFLRQIGVVEPGELRHIKIPTAVGFVIARDTIFNNLPKR